MYTVGMAASDAYQPFHVIRGGVIYELQLDPSGPYTISIPALPGCVSQGETFEEAFAMITEAMELWIDVAREKGLVIPSPFELDRAS